MQPLVATAVTAVILARALLHGSLTPLGIVAALITAVAHALHPWPVFYALLIVFFLGGTTVTKVGSPSALSIWAGALFAHRNLDGDMCNHSRVALYNAVD